jgi:hypothetical protein
MGSNQISGSLSLDVSSLAGNIRDEVIQSLAPHFGQLLTMLGDLADQRAQQPLSAGEIARALYRTGMVHSNVMDGIAAGLIADGYALIRVTPERIEGAPAEQLLYAVDEAKISVVDLPPDEEHSAPDRRTWRS